MTLLSSFAPFCSLKLILILWFLHHVNLGVELLTLLMAMLRNCQIEELEKIIQLVCKLG